MKTQVSILTTLLLALCFLFQTNVQAQSPKKSAKKQIPTVQDNDDDKERSVIIARYGAGPCYGNCAVYEVSFFSDGKLIYEGKKFTDRLGKYQRNLNKSLTEQLLRQLRQANIMDLPEEFPMGIPDVQSKTITYFDSGRIKSTMWQKKANKDLIELSEIFENFVNEEDGDWKKISDEPQKILTYAKGACFGSCPVFEVSMYDDGKVIYKGKQNTKRMGKWSKTIPRSEREKIFYPCANANLERFPDQYESQIADLASKTLTYYYAPRDSKKIVWSENADDVILRISKLIETIANEERGWTLEQGIDR